MCLKIDWASLIPGRKFTVFLCLTLYLRAISKYKPPGKRGACTWKVFLRWECGGLIFKGAYTWRGLFSEFRLPATQATTHGRELLHSIMKTTDRRYQLYISTPL